ncbi:MAG: SprT-like domain-containing protein [Candidatus Xenobia bacterium]
MTTPAVNPHGSLIEHWGHLWGIPDLVNRIHIEPAPRQTASAARCHPSTGRIRLNPSLAPEQLELTLCHEAAHVAVHHLFGPTAAPHGPEWRDLMTLALPDWRTRTTPSRPSPPRRRPVYLHRCPLCHYSRRDRARTLRFACPVCLDQGRTSPLEVVAIYRPE